MSYRSRPDLPVGRRVVGRRIAAGDPDGRSLETTPQDEAALERESRIASESTTALPAEEGCESGLLGEPLLGDETASLGPAAPGQAVANDYDAPPSRRRIGEAIVGDSQNLQGRPNTSLTGGGDTTATDGGSGL